AVAEALVRHGQKVESLDAPPEKSFDFVKEAQSKQLDILTNDSKFVNEIFNDNIFFNRSIVFLQLPGEAVEQDDAIDRLFERYKRLSPGRMYTVTESRVKIRQLPGSH